MNIYEYTWKGLKTGWDYKITIFPSGDTDVSSPTTVILPPGSLDVKKLKLEYDKYLSGLPVTPVLEIDIDFNLIPSSTDYDDFKKSIFDPVTELSVPYVAVFDAGTIFKFEIKYNNNSESSVNIYRELLTGCYRREGTFDFDVIGNTVKIDVRDINRVVHDSMPWLVLILASESTDITRDGYIDIGYIKNTTNYGIGHAQDGYDFLFSKHENIKTFIQAAGQEIYRKLMRDSTLSYTVELPLPSFYKQSYNSDGSLGAALSDSDLYILNKVKKGTAWVAGLLDDEDENGIPARYPNGTWDYISELCELSLSRGIFLPGRMSCVPIYGSVGALQTVTLSKGKLNKMDIKPADIVKTATASLYESHDDDHFSDIEKREETNTGTQNEGECTVPVVFNNLPSCVDYSETGYSFEVNSPRETRRAFFPHVTNLFYLDQPALIKATSDPQLFRVHEFCNWSLGDNIYSTDLPGCGFTAFDAGAYSYDQPSQCIAAMQAASGLPKWLAKTVLALFGNKEQKMLEFDVDFNEYTWFAAGGSVGFPWYRPDVKFIFDLSTISPYLSGTNTAWNMISTELDFEKETAKVGLLQRMV
jgi:hypothetical protein